VNAAPLHSSSITSETKHVYPIFGDRSLCDRFNFKSFVEQTGGKYFYGRNDLNNEIEDSIARNTISTP